RSRTCRRSPAWPTVISASRRSPATRRIRRSPNSTPQIVGWNSSACWAAPSSWPPSPAATVASASRELLARREDVWGFLAEPYHLSDWWPGILGVVPDRRGFAPGARWQVRLQTSNIFIGRRVRETMLLIRDIDLYERWSWHLLATKLEVEIRL